MSENEKRASEDERGDQDEMFGGRWTARRRRGEQLEGTLPSSWSVGRSVDDDDDVVLDVIDPTLSLLKATPVLLPLRT